MEEFEKKLKKAKKGQSKTGVIFLIFAIILLVIGITTGNPDKESWAIFDGLDSGEHYKADILYLIGPFAEYTEDYVVTEELYTAVTKDNEYILVKTKANTDLPMLGEDVTEENIDTVEPVTIYGYSEILESDVEEFLVEFWNQVYEEEIFTTYNYSEYFGYSYLDTTNQPEQTTTACYVLAAVFGVVGIIYLIGNRKNKQNTSKLLRKLEEDGKLEVLKNEYTNGAVDKYKKLNLEITENYIVSYAPQLVIVPVADVVNAYRTNMIDGVYQPCRYIALETRNNEKYYVAMQPLDSKKSEFENALEKIKRKVMQGGN